MVSEIPYITPEEYLKAKRAAEYKSEYCNGRVYAMAGGSLRHNFIATNTTVAMAAGLTGGLCRAFHSDIGSSLDVGRNSHSYSSRHAKTAGTTNCARGPQRLAPLLRRGIEWKNRAVRISPSLNTHAPVTPDRVLTLTVPGGAFYA